MSRKAAALIIVACATVLVSRQAAAAVMLSLVPSSNTIALGDTVSLDLNVSGLGSAGPPSVGLFDVDVDFDSTILTLNSVTFGPLLGIPDTDFSSATSTSAETKITVALPSPGVVGLKEESLLAAAALDALQGASITLASLAFTGGNVGTSLSAGVVFAVDDAFGTQLLGFPDTLGAVTITVVPEPATLAIFAIGLAGLGFMVRWRGTAV